MSFFVDFGNGFEYKEIDFEKQDETYALIYYNGERVGHLENYSILGYYIVEVYYKRLKVGKNKSSIIKRFVRDYCEWYTYQKYSEYLAQSRGFKIIG